MKSRGNKNASDFGEVKVQHARKGLTFFLGFLFVLSLIINTVVIMSGNILLIVVYMFVPAIASILTRLLLREGFADVSFQLGSVKVWRGIGLGLLIPMLICGITYSTAWMSGIASFQLPVGGTFETYYHALGLQYLPTPLSFVLMVVVAGIAGSIINLIPVMGEEVGWRGYMLTRLVEAKAPRPILLSGLIWATWHIPIVISGMYVAGPSVLLSVLGIYLCIIPFSYITAQLRLATGSVWPSVIIHTSWNSVIQGPFTRATTGEFSDVWIGESGLLTAFIIIIAAIIVSRTVKVRELT